MRYPLALLRVCQAVGCVLAGAAALGGTSTGVRAHAALEASEAAIGAPYKATIMIGHGCGGTATTRLQVKIPAGVIGIKPMPKAGWSVATSRADYGKSYNYFHGAKLSEGVTEITWSGGALLDAHYDEFVFSAFISDSLAAGTTIHFPVVQTCEKGEHRWVEIPADGVDPHALKAPAPALKLIAAKSAATATNKTFKVGNLTIDTPWARATPGGAKVAGGYLKITNNGKEADRVVGGSLAVAGALEIHEVTMVDNVMKMRRLPQGLEIKAGESVELKPGGYHVMFMNLTAGLAAGQTVKGTLEFEKAGRIDIEYSVAPMGAQTPGHSHH